VEFEWVFDYLWVYENAKKCQKMCIYCKIIVKVREMLWKLVEICWELVKIGEN